MYDNSMPTKDHRNSPITRKILNRQQGKKAVVKNAVYEILLTQKASATNHEALEFLDSDYDLNNL